MVGATGLSTTTDVAGSIVSLSITILVLAGLITFVALEGKIVDKITPAANWLRE